jgi:hypothetical protein
MSHACTPDFHSEGLCLFLGSPIPQLGDIQVLIPILGSTQRFNTTQATMNTTGNKSSQFTSMSLSS